EEERRAASAEDGCAARRGAPAGCGACAALGLRSGPEGRRSHQRAGRGVCVRPGSRRAARAARGRMRTVPFQPLDPALYREIVRRALAEDLGWGDVTTEATVPAELRARGVIVVKCECVI